MSSEQKIEKLRAEIQGSRLLDDHEKADWLNLLDLMNDKQIGELEEILQAPAPANAEAPVLQTLSHISNLPTQMGGAAAGARPIAPPRPTPPPSAARPPLRPMPQMVKSGVSTEPLAPISVGATPLPPKPSGLTPAQFDDLENVDAFTLEQFRSFDPETIVAALHPLVLHYGYFTVLQHLEASKLYESYLATGKKLLSGTALEPRFNLTQAEFETMTDVLQALRLNKS